MKKQGHNNNIDKKNQSKFPNTKANNKNIVKIPLKPLSKSCVEIGKYDINDTTHIFMQKTNQNGAVTEGYHFVFHGSQQPTIYHTGDGHKYVQIDEELKALIDQVTEHYKLSDSKKIKSLDETSLSKFFRYLLFIRMFNQRQQRIIADIYDKGKEILSVLPNVEQQLSQNEINKLKAKIFQKQLQLADAQTSADDYLNDEYLKQLFIVNAQVNEINKKAQVVKKHNEERDNKATKMLRDQCRQQIKQARRRLIGQLFPIDNSTLPITQYNKFRNDTQFKNIFNQANKLLSINISRGPLVSNTRPLSAILNLYGKNKKAICSFTIQQKNESTYTITLTFGRMQYTQIVSADSINDRIVKIDNTQQTLENITNLFYNKLSSYFGVEIQSEQKKIPSVFNVKDIEYITDINSHFTNFTKHQQGYVDKNNTYQLIYEAHPKMCNCDKHYDGPGVKSNVTKDLVLYYGGNEDGDERNKKENIFNRYCNKINGFEKLKNPVSVWSSMFWNKQEPTIHNACAYGDKKTSDKWRQKHKNWQNRNTVKTEENKIKNISEEEEEEDKNSDQETQYSDNAYKDDVKIDQDEIGDSCCWYSLCCLSKKTHKDDTKTVIMEHNYDNINESELSGLDDIPLEIGKSMFAFAKKEKTKQKFNLLSCCMESNKDEKENEINIQTNVDDLIGSKVYEEIPINGNNAKINDNNAKFNIGNNNNINNNINKK